LAKEHSNGFYSLIRHVKKAAPPLEIISRAHIHMKIRRRLKSWFAAIFYYHSSAPGGSIKKICPGRRFILAFAHFGGARGQFAGSRVSLPFSVSPDDPNNEQKCE